MRKEIEKASDIDIRRGMRVPLQRAQLVPAPRWTHSGASGNAKSVGGYSLGQTVTVAASDRSPWGEPGELWL